MQWIVHGERALYESEWVNLSLVDVEIPDERRFDHHVIREPRAAAGTVIHRRDEVLLLWRHRFITDTWGWEIPAGRIDPGESPQEAAVRETIEETGWRPGPLQRLGAYAPNNGSTDQVFHLFTADGGTRVGEPTDPSESERIEWVEPDKVRWLIEGGQVCDGMSLTGLLWALAFSAI